MSLSYAPIQHEDIPACASGMIYRISYGVQYGELVDPQFVYKVQLIDHGQVEGEAGLCLPDQRDVAMRVAQAMSRFIARPHPL